MKGLVLCEFVEYLEERLGSDAAQELIDEAELASGGAYSRVGRYDYQEMIKLLTDASSKHNADAGVLLNEFSDHLFGVFKRDYGAFFEGKENAIAMLKHIDDHIHVEVQKLYPDAELPKFSFEETDGKLDLYYTSPRPLADVAQALVTSCLKHFGNQEQLVAAELADDRKSAHFVVQTV